MSKLTTAGQGTTAKGITLIYAQILPVMAIVSLFPAIPKLFAEFGAHPNAGFLIPAIVTAPSLCAALFSSLAGIIADRYGRRRSFIFGMALYVLAGLVPLFVNDLGLIIASRAVLGMAEAFAITISSALIGDYFGEQRHRWTAWVGISISVAGTGLIAAGGALADISWRGPFAIYLLAIPGLIMALLFIDEPKASGGSPAAARPQLPYPWKEAFLIGGVTLVTSALYYVEPLNIARVLDAKGAGSSTQIGLIQSATSIAYIGGAILYRRVHHWSIGQLLGLTGVLIGVGQLVIGLGPTWQVVSLGAVIQQVGGGFVIPALMAWGQAILPLEQRGRGMGIWATAFFSGTFACGGLVAVTTSLTGGLTPAMTALGILTLVFAFLARLIPAGNRSTSTVNA
ncbi:MULTISPECIES: MFS transporter [unclassified Azospirillum]|uniref:MFS transporter n=1 Tax=unclassified Azospirillum TaxID=2630922 RepID=UPI000B73F98E|nr:MULTISPECIES: MFS transporter [unclassified Azospirillum]SNS51293.1 Predicted arabinose efflux permease, MFS family [Azospirillum sp. RU38E]SNS70304.1 Predicted arabinose efflux permease, MFS family [Azospirillum sp. RU37A]